MSKNKIRENIILCIPALILAYTFLLYFKSITNDFALGLDDEEYILNNPFIRHFNFNNIKIIFTSFYSYNYHPLTTLSYMLEYIFFGANPLIYHFDNLLIHLLNTFLVFKLTEQLSGKKITAIITSLLFAIHPMHVESVAWLSERKDVLYTLFYLLSVIVYFKYLKSGLKRKYYILTLLLFTVSLLSKSAAVTLSVLLIIIDLYTGRKFSAKLIFEKTPFFLLSLFFGILAIYSQGAEGKNNELSLIFNIYERIFLFAYSILFYIVKLFIPFKLSVMHYYPDIHKGFLPWQYYASLPILILIICLIIKNVFVRKDIIFGTVFFITTLSVMLFVPVGPSHTSERYTYMPYIGLFFIAGQVVSNLENKNIKNTFLIVFCLFVITFSYQTWQRIGVWKNSITLFNDLIKKNPSNYHTYWTRGLAYYNSGNTKAAMLDCNYTIMLRPDFAGAYSIRGVIKASEGDLNGAMGNFNKSIALKPNDAGSYLNRGNLKIMLKDYSGAKKDFDYSLKLNHSDRLAYYNRGISRLYLQDITGACEDWQKANSLGYDASVMLRQYCY